jgi:hypothetical protein
MSSKFGIYHMSVKEKLSIEEKEKEKEGKPKGF